MLINFWVHNLIATSDLPSLHFFKTCDMWQMRYSNKLLLITQSSPQLISQSAVGLQDLSQSTVRRCQLFWTLQFNGCDILVKPCYNGVAGPKCYHNRSFSSGIPLSLAMWRSQYTQMRYYNRVVYNGAIGSTPYIAIAGFNLTSLHTLRCNIN